MQKRTPNALNMYNNPDQDNDYVFIPVYSLSRLSAFH